MVTAKPQMSVVCDDEDSFPHSYSVAPACPLGTLRPISAPLEPGARASATWNITSDQWGGRVEKGGKQLTGS